MVFYHIQKYVEVNPEQDNIHFNNLTVFNNYHFGGYARSTPEFIDFINTFNTTHGIALDPIYTGKLVFGILDLLKKGFFPENSSIVILHSGGLQGIKPYNEFVLASSQQINT